MVSVDGSLFVQIANFLLLVWVLNMVLFKPVREILTKRKQKISGIEADMETCNLAVTDRDRAYISGIKEARLAGQKRKEDLIGVAVGKELEIINKINADALAGLEEAKVKIEGEIESVRRSLEDNVDVFARAIGQKILGRSL